MSIIGNWYKDFKEMEIGTIPKEWEVVRLGEVAEIHDSKRIPLSEMERSKRKGSYPYCGANGIIDYIDDYIFEGEFVLLAEDGGDYKRFGNSAYIMKGKFWVNNHAHILKAMEDKVINLFLYYFFNFSDLNFYIVGSTRKKLNQEQMRKILIPLPPIPEQKKITEILSTVDEAIEKVDESITRTERLKKGLMQELLNGSLRVGESMSLKVRELGEFKDTEIGRIPKEWEVVRLESLINEVKNGFASGKRDENGIVQIRMNNVTTDGLLILDSYLKVPVPDNVNDWILEDGDFLFNNTNSYDLVGKSTIFKGVPFPCTFSNHFTRIRFRNNLVLPEIILYHFLILWEKGYFKSVAIRHVGQSAVHTKYLLKLKLPLPPLPEQQKIAEILSTVDKRLELLRNKKEKLTRIKKGLMNDLLTGKKRVKV